MTGTPQQYRTKLPATLFIKTHRSFILNRTKIQEIPWFNNMQVILTNRSKVPVSRSYVKEFKEKLQSLEMSNAFQVVIFALGKEFWHFMKKPLKTFSFIYLTHRKQTKGSEEEWKRKYIHFTTSSSFCHYYVNRQRGWRSFQYQMPASVIGMVLLFIGLCTKVVKLEQVEGLGNSLSTVITFYLFLQGFP